MSEKPQKEIQNVSEPNLFRELFPYKEVPRFKLNGKAASVSTEHPIWITDTTFRDGQQARVPYTVEQIADLFDFLHRLDNGTGTIRQSEFFLYSRADKQAVQECLEKGYKFPEVTGWIRANPKDFELVKKMGLKETGILTSCSDYHIFLKLGWDRNIAAGKYRAIVEAAISEGIRPRCHLEDVTRADFDGFVIPFVQQLMMISEGAPDNLKVKVRLCDTMGYGLHNPSVDVPRGVPILVTRLISETGIPHERLEWHGHNDFHLATSNALVAWDYGVSAVNCTLLGTGERTGNTPLEAMVIHYLARNGNPGVDTLAITDIAKYYQKIGTTIPTNYPLVGRDFNTTQAGIHADGLMKSEEIYNPFDTTRILGIKPGVTITDRSGLAGVVVWVSDHYGVLLEKTNPGIRGIYDEIDRQYNIEQRSTAMSVQELHTLVAKHLPEVAQKHLGV